MSCEARLYEPCLWGISCALPIDRGCDTALTTGLTQASHLLHRLPQQLYLTLCVQCQFHASCQGQLTGCIHRDRAQAHQVLGLGKAGTRED